MIEELLKNIDRRNFYETRFSSESLEAVLCGMCDLIYHQQSQINELRDEIKRRPTFDEFETAISRKSNEVKNLSVRFETSIETVENKISSMNLIVDKMNKDSGERIESLKADIIQYKDITDEQFRSQNLIFNTTVKNISSSTDSTQQTVSFLESQINDFRDLLRGGGIATIESLSERIDQLDQKISSVNEVNMNTQNNFQILNESLNRKQEEIREEFESELHALTRRLDEIQTRFTIDPKFGSASFNPSSVTDTDLSPLILTVHRDTRRLDGVDEQISSVRLECENVSSAMSNAQNTLQQFNHAIYDFQCQLDQTRSEILTRFQTLQPFFSWVLSSVFEIWNTIHQVSLSNSHIAATTSKGLEDLYNLINSISTRPLPTIHPFDETVIESTSIRDQINEKKQSVDVEKQIVQLRPIYKHWKTVIPKGELKEIPDFKKTMDPYKPSPLLEYSIDKSKPMVVYKENPLVLNTLEEIRVKTNKFEQSLPQFMNEVHSILQQYSLRIDTKMDTIEVDRLFTKIQSTLKKMQKAIENHSDLQTSIKGFKSEESIETLNDTLISTKLSTRKVDNSTNSLFSKPPPMHRPRSSLSKRPNSRQKTGQNSPYISPRDGILVSDQL